MNDGLVLWERYLERRAVLDALRPYAQLVLAALSSPGRTPVEPLATMGADGGPLICERCLKPMVLEGGGFQGVHADEGWRRNPTPGWHSYISGGMVVRLETNGTLRIFHGYPGRSGCVRDHDAAPARSVKRSPDEVSAALEDVASHLLSIGVEATDDVLNDVYRVLLRPDPGLGVNRP